MSTFGSGARFCVRGFLISAAALALAGAVGQPVRAQTPPPKAPAREWTLFGSLRSREEVWSWFGTGAGQGQYAFNGTLLRVGATHNSRSDDFTLELAAPMLFGLPNAAVQPAPMGQLGFGGSYRDASGRQNAGLFVKQAFWKGKRPGHPASYLRAGRFEFIDGTETSPADPTLGWVKRERIAHRLLGNFGFSHVQRSFDGLHFSDSRGRQNTTILLARPTRGAFDLHGQDGIDGVGVAYGAVTFAQGSGRSPGELRLFGAEYEDSRAGVTKTDNRPPGVRALDKQGIRIGTLGGHYLRAVNGGAGITDGMLWGAWQTGQWGALRHDAYAFAAEAGFQPKGVPWKPWIRTGYFEASGDNSPADGVHGTFFPLLPTPRQYARFPFYTEMNLKDAFVQLILRPTNGLTARLDYHRLALASPNDLWYSGGGAFQDKPSFGYAGRPSGGFGSLGNLFDISLDWQAKPQTTVSLYLGVAEGGNVTQATFPGKNAAFGYLEVMQRW